MYINFYIIHFKQTDIANMLHFFSVLKNDKKLLLFSSCIAHQQYKWTFIHSCSKISKYFLFLTPQIESLTFSVKFHS